MLEEIDRTLDAKGIGAVARRSTLNIVLELAFNSVIHSREGATAPDLLVIALRDGHVSVSMFGGGRPTQVDRLERIIASVLSIATPPHHQSAAISSRIFAGPAGAVGNGQRSCLRG